jgi:hypothetical protein
MRRGIACNGFQTIAGRIASAAIVVGLFASVSSSTATAQDSRLSDGSQCAGLNHSVLGSLGLELLSTPSDGPVPLEPANRPCSGPLCSRAPDSPTPPPIAPPSVPTMDPWALWAASADLAQDRLAFPAISEAVTIPLHLAAGVFHPPR